MLPVLADSFPRGLQQKLSNPFYYQRAIERLHRKFASETSEQLYKRQPEGYTFGQVFMDRKRLSALLARSVAAGKYQFSPAALKDISADSRRRIVYSFSLIDRIVHGAVYLMLAEDMQPLMPPAIYSYIKGRTKMQVIDQLTHFLRRHRRRHERPQDRGVYVLRCDIKAFGSSIPVMPSSPLWGQLRAIFEAAYGRPPSTEEWLLLEQMIRPDILHADGGHYQPLTGIPDGAPISSLLLNLYVTPVDRAFSAIEGGFYARYSDDMLFMHPDREIFSKAESQLNILLAPLGLVRNEKKEKRLFFNTAGRPAGGLKGSSHIEFLGFKIAFNGGITLKTEKAHAWQRDMASRIHSTARATQALPFDQRGQILCQMLNDALDPHLPQAHPYASIVRSLVNDRRQLKQLDYLLARKVLQALFSDNSAKNFRQVPYRKLRRVWKLRSLVYARNH